MPRLVPLFAAGLLALAPLSARAAVEWLCGLSASGVQVVCVAEAGPMPAVDLVAPPRTLVNGVAFPLARDRVYTVELWSPPTEMAFVELLARATMCYRTPDCQVRWMTEAPRPGR